MSEPESILQEAHRLTHGDRGAAYGLPHEDYGRVAQMFNALMAPKLKAPLTAHDMALAMCCVKLSRQVNSPKRDNMVDLAGYAWVGHECAEHERREAHSVKAPRTINQMHRAKSAKLIRPEPNARNTYYEDGINGYPSTAYPWIRRCSDNGRYRWEANCDWDGICHPGMDLATASVGQNLAQAQSSGPVPPRDCQNFAGSARSVDRGPGLDRPVGLYPAPTGQVGHPSPYAPQNP